MRVLHTRARLRVDAGASILDLHHDSALSEPRIACVPYALYFADFQHKPGRNGFVPTSLSFNVDIFQHHEVLSLQLPLDVSQLTRGLA